MRLVNDLRQRHCSCCYRLSLLQTRSLNGAQSYVPPSPSWAGVGAAVAAAAGAGRCGSEAGRGPGNSQWARARAAGWRAREAVAVPIISAPPGPIPGSLRLGVSSEFPSGAGSAPGPSCSSSPDRGSSTPSPSAFRVRLHVFKLLILGFGDSGWHSAASQRYTGNKPAPSPC